MNPSRQLPSAEAPPNSKLVSLTQSLSSVTYVCVCMFSWVDVNQTHTTVPKVLTHLLATQDTISDADFFKEDMYSSPKFKYDQRKFKCNQYDL